MKKCTSFEEQKGARYIWGNVYFGIIVFSCLSSTKPCLRFLLICFAWEIKGFYQSSLGNEVDFRDIMNVSPNILAKNQNFKKPRHSFVDETVKKTNFMAPFYGLGSTASRLVPLQGGSLLYTTKFPVIPGAHFVDLGRMKG